MVISKTANSTDFLFQKEVQGYPRIKLFVYDSMEPIGQTWDAHIPDRNIFLTSPYLRVVEEAGPDGLKNYYAIVFRDEDPFLVLYCQFKHFNAAESLQVYQANGSEEVSSKLKRISLGAIAGMVDFNALVCGNILVTGEHAYRFNSRVPDLDEVEFIPDVLEAIRSGIEETGVSLPVIFVKDFYDKRLQNTRRCFARAHFNELVFQPNMVLYLDPAWTSIDDYMDSLRSKYRVRTKRARKFIQALEHRELPLQEVMDRKSEMFGLYSEIALHVEFNLFLLSPDYLFKMKSALGEKFKVFGYFKGNELLGFYSMVLNGNELEAHFLGYRQEINQEFQLYHNMLLDHIEVAIEAGVGKIVFARTALEIKSSVGAIPEEMHCYIRHNNRIYNTLIPNIFHTLNPEVDWEQRHPFSENRKEGN